MTATGNPKSASSRKQEEFLSSLERMAVNYQGRKQRILLKRRHLYLFLANRHMANNLTFERLKKLKSEIKYKRIRATAFNQSLPVRAILQYRIIEYVLFSIGVEVLRTCLETTF